MPFYSVSDLNMSRETVYVDFANAERNHNTKHPQSQYIYDNQRIDADHIVSKLYGSTIRAISITKRTKVGMNGLMIQLAKQLSTHFDLNFRIHKNNIFIITGMSNRQWEDEMRDEVPVCFHNNVCHHGKLASLHDKLRNVRNAVIIIDEIDTGDREDQRLHRLLMGCNIWDLEYMVRNNVRFVFVSATITNQLYDLTQWSDEFHYNFTMTVPPAYVGHNDFLEMGIIHEYFPVYSDETVQSWITQDILPYGDDYRVHLLRTRECFIPTVKHICEKNGIRFYVHTSEDRMSSDELSEIFESSSSAHTVVVIKGFYRRANLIPNEWKLRIGAVMEQWTPKPMMSVQVQGLVGRMTGYWREQLPNHRTGPYRTSVEAIEEYERFYADPVTFYETHKLSNRISLVNTTKVANYYKISGQPVKSQQIAKFGNLASMRVFCKKQIKDEIGIKQRRPRIKPLNDAGFQPAYINGEIRVFSCAEVDAMNIKGICDYTFKICPCYHDVLDHATLEYWVVYMSQ